MNSNPDRAPDLPSQPVTPKTRFTRFVLWLLPTLVTGWLLVGELRKGDSTVNRVILIVLLAFEVFGTIANLTEWIKSLRHRQPPSA
jgi:hypothetical protein